MRPADATEVVDAMTTGDAMATDWDAVLADGAEVWETLIVGAVGGVYGVRRWSD
jgi:hypothetical protein